MRKKIATLIFLPIFLLTFNIPAKDKEPNSAEEFQKAVTLYRQRKYAEAEKAFEILSKQKNYVELPALFTTAAINTWGLK